jgi:hypothetical protein
MLSDMRLWYTEVTPSYQLDVNRPSGETSTFPLSKNKPTKIPALKQVASKGSFFDSEDEAMCTTGIVSFQKIGHLMF